MRRILAILIFLQCSCILLAQDFPEARDHHAVTFDSFRNRLILFGGNGKANSSYLSDLWEFDGQSWLKVNDKEMTERSSHVLLFVPKLNKSLLIGGVSMKGEYLSAMGFWDGNVWNSIPEGPSPRYSPAVAYDEYRDVLVLFSGAGRGEDEMWELKDGKWTQVSLLDTRPSARVRSQMVYDYVRKTVILFGGYAGGQSIGDMWEWDGYEWTRLEVNVPPARNNHLMVSDRVRKKVVLFGGKNRQDGILFGDTWEWDGYKWTKLSETGPEARDMTAGAFDENSTNIILFGGRNSTRAKLGDLWSWNGKEWSRID